ncbi:MAG TPA: TIM barrel protein [Ktedonosporobacter sp.]|nr:TIM barrel protein [Ktedonosporobacter sp.]
MTAIRIANAPCSWGTLEFAGMSGERITYEQMLDELRDTGYVGSELGDWGFMPTEPVALKEELAKRSLTMVGAFVPVALKYEEEHGNGAEQALQVARLLAAVEPPLRGPEVIPVGRATTLGSATESQESDQRPFVILADANGTDPVRTRNAGRVTAEMGLNKQEWEIFARGAEHIARVVRDVTGLPTAFHHHCAGYVETPEEIARFLDLTDPALLGLVFDTGHYLYGTGPRVVARPTGMTSGPRKGGDPTGRNDGLQIEAGLDRFGERIWHVHFKDCQPEVANQARTEGWDYFAAVQHGVFCELGRGNVPFTTVAGWLRRRGYQGWIVVEQDVLPGMGSPKESAQRNRAYLKTIGL